MKCYLGWSVVFVAVFGGEAAFKWCETNGKTGCVGQAKKFTRMFSDTGNPFSSVEVAPYDTAIVVDWDKDGDLDVIVNNVRNKGKGEGIRYYERQASGEYLELTDTNPFKGIYCTDFSTPEVVDWDGDGHLDLIASAGSIGDALAGGSIRFFKRQSDGSLVEQKGYANPFSGIKGELAFGIQLSAGDWDGDGDLDLLAGQIKGLRYYEQRNGLLVAANHSNLDSLKSSKLMPKVFDWDGDGDLDLFLLPNVYTRMLTEGVTPEKWSARKIQLLEQQNGQTRFAIDNPLSNIDLYGTGMSLVDVNGDGKTDVVCGGKDGLEVFFQNEDGQLKEMSTSGVPLSSIPIKARQQACKKPYCRVSYTPLLADWDGDGDQDLVLVDGFRGRDGPAVRFLEHLDNHLVIEHPNSPFQNMSCNIELAYGFCMADWDGDGMLDLIGFTWTSLNHGSSVGICLQVDGSFVQIDTHPFLGVKFGYSDPLMLDWDNDGDLDLLVLYKKAIYWFEQLSDGTSVEHILEVRPIAYYAAGDMDGDGDIDLLTVSQGSQDAKFFERTEDGELEQASDERNPFKGMLKVEDVTNAFALGDWDGDGQADVIHVTDLDIRQYKQELDHAFVEAENPFEMIVTGMKGSYADFFDMDGDGDLDLILRGFRPLQRSFRYFEHIDEELVERFDEENPFHNAEVPYPETTFAVGDVDGDGHVDIVEGKLFGSFSYLRQENGHFKSMEGDDNPFGALRGSPLSPPCPTLIDWDGDGNMDVVAGADRGHLELYQQVNQSFQRVEESPFQNVSILVIAGLPANDSQRFVQKFGSLYDAEISKLISGEPEDVQVAVKTLVQAVREGFWATCSAFVDLDDDGDLDLIVSGGAFSGFIYFEQDHGSFVMRPEMLKEVPENLGTQTKPTVIDWDGDGYLDLIVTGRLHGDINHFNYYTLGACYPQSQPYCKLGSCNHKTAQCECYSGVEGSECSRCSQFHFKDLETCKACPGYNTLEGTCSRRGVCEDDADARSSSQESNKSKYQVLTSFGSGQCKCLAPFHGDGCHEGECPSGQFLQANAEVPNISDWYRNWDACMPCESGRYKIFVGNAPCELCEAGRYQQFMGQTDCLACPAGRSSQPGAAECYVCPYAGTHSSPGSATCDPCPDGFVASENHSTCVRCGHGSRPNTNRTECIRCDEGYIAVAGSVSCVPCAAGSAPNDERSSCSACESGMFAAERSERCLPCPEGSVPDATGGECKACPGQLYAMPGDDECRECTFPFMVLGEDNQCTILYFVLFLLGFCLLIIFSYIIAGWVRVWYLKKHLKDLEAMHEYEELHTVKASYAKYGMWQHKANRLIGERKQKVSEESKRLGVSISFALDELESLYAQKAQDTEWRFHEIGAVTECGFRVKVRCCDLETGACNWGSLNVVPPPENPNFHEMAGLLAYGPDALGKGKICPRDGKPDCSLVDALRKDGKSGPANWFMSWAWGYSLKNVCGALRKWWTTHAVVAGSSPDSTCVWWCFFVNNQFRLLQDGETAETQELLAVFAKPLESAGKVLMCMDKFKECSYTSRIWCIFEVFSAVRRSIPITLIMPELNIDKSEMPIVTLKELKAACSIDAAQAQASVKADEDIIKAHILATMGSFTYVNQTVEEALWIEVIKVLEESTASTASGASGATADSSTDLTRSGEYTSSSTEGIQIQTRNLNPAGCCLQ